MLDDFAASRYHILIPGRIKKKKKKKQQGVGNGSRELKPLPKCFPSLPTGSSQQQEQRVKTMTRWQGRRSGSGSGKATQILAQDLARARIPQGGDSLNGAAVNPQKDK